MNKITTFIFRLFIFCCGSFLLGFGIAYFIKAKYGSDAMSSFVQGLNHQIPLSQGTWNAIVSYVMVFMALLIDKNQVGFGTIIYPFVCSYAINYGVSLIPSPSSIIIAMTYLLLGILFVAISIAITAKSNCGKSSYDAFIFALMNRLNLKYNVVRWIMDISMLVIGALLGGTFGVGTIFILLVMGNLAMLFMNYFDKIILYLHRIK